MSHPHHASGFFAAGGGGSGGAANSLLTVFQPQQMNQSQQPQQPHQNGSTTQDGFVFTPASALLMSHDDVDAETTSPVVAPQPAPLPSPPPPPFFPSAPANPTTEASAAAASVNNAAVFGQAMLASFLYAQLSGAANAAASVAGVPGAGVAAQSAAHPAQALWQHWANAAAVGASAGGVAAAALPMAMPGIAGLMPGAVPPPTAVPPATVQPPPLPALPTPPPAAKAAAPSEMESLRSYQHHSNAVSQFTKHFKELPFNMQVDAIKNPPSFVGPPDVLRALISLPLQSQALIIKKLPSATQKSLVRSLTPSEKQRLHAVLSGKSVFFDDDVNDEFFVVPNVYIERAMRISQEEGVLPAEHSTRYAASAAAASAVASVEHANDASSSGATDAAAADSSLLSPPVLASTRLNLSGSRRPDTSFLAVIQKMMFSFGDIHYVDPPDGDAGGAPALAWPSLYTAMRISDYVVEFLQDILSKLPRRQTLQMLLRLFPLQARVWVRWRHMNTISKQEQTSRLKKVDNDGVAGMQIGPNASSESDDDGDTRRKRRGARIGVRASRKRKVSSKSSAAPALSSKRPSSKKDIATTRHTRKKQKTGDSDSDSDADTAPTARRKKVDRKRAKLDSIGGGGDSGSESDGMMPDGSSSSDSSDSAYSSGASTSASDTSDDDVDADDADEDQDMDVRMAQADESDPELQEVEDIIATASNRFSRADVKEEAKETTNPTLTTSDPTEGSAAATVASGAAAASAPFAAPPAVSAPSASYELYLSQLDLWLGPQTRLALQDAASAPMITSHHHTFTKSRETSFVRPVRRLRDFITWLRIPTWINKNVLSLLGFLAWDRIGMVVEVCARLRDCSRHARSNVPFTVYEVNKAIAHLETDPQTSTMHIKDHQLVGVIKHEMSEYNSSRGKSGLDAAAMSDASVAAGGVQPGLESLSMQFQSVHERELANSQHLQQLQSAGIDIGSSAPNASTPHATDSSSRADADKAKRDFLPRSIVLGSTVPPPPAAPVPTQSPPSTAHYPKNGRFSESARVRLLQMSEECLWKYRRANPAIQAIHREEGLALDQIRGWMANNKPANFKRTGQKKSAINAAAVAAAEAASTNTRPTAISNATDTSTTTAASHAEAEADTPEATDADDATRE